VEEWDHVIGDRYEWPTWLLFHPKLWLSFFCFCFHPPYHQLFHCPHSQSSKNWCLDPLHCMHHHVDINSFPRSMAWNAESPVRYNSTFGGVFLFPTGAVRLNLHWSRPCSPVSIWWGIVATTWRPLVSHGSIVCLISFPVSLWHISLHTDTSKLIILALFYSTDIDAPNWNAVSPWSPPTTTWTRANSEGWTDLLEK